ncbi:MAG TPA: imidazolonepropionase, partial [Bacteroidetes bacterium]|nr:imidazolonepropionase [Bacteroidota bacterium]
EGYIRLLIEEMIPAVARERLAAACDVFCETGVFSLEESRRILTAAREHGLAIKVHADQLTPLGGAKLAAELGALSADHLERIDEEGVELLAHSGVAAGLLPIAAHFLRDPRDPPVREMIRRGVICALGTDFNPGSGMCEVMPMAMHLAVIRFSVSSSEALWMATAGSARALDIADRGWIGPGALADLVAWDASGPAMIPYHFGVNLAAKVFKRGALAAENGRVIR